MLLRLRKCLRDRVGRFNNRPLYSKQETIARINVVEHLNLNRELIAIRRVFHENRGCWILVRKWYSDCPLFFI